MGSGSERSDDIVDGDRGDGMRVYMELRVWPRCHRWLWCGVTNREGKREREREVA